MQEQIKSNRWVNYIGEAVALVFTGLFVLALQPHLTVDFWYDEVMSLEEFILVPISKTLTDYSAPNNHIFFNLLMNSWCKLWGINTFAQAANNVFIVRLLPLFFTLTTILYVYLTGKKYFSKGNAFISVIILLATIPFYNFAAQVRGYGLSMMLCSMLLYYGLWFYSTPKVKYGIIVSLLTAFLLYTIPSNLYAILSTILVLSFIVLGQWEKYDIRLAVKFNAARLILWLMAGIGLGIVLYLPVGEQVVNNEYVQSEGLFRWKMWNDAVSFYKLLYNWEIWILILLAVGIVLAIRQKKTRNNLLPFIGLLFFPFFIAFVQGANPFDRTFLWVIPVFSLTLGSIVASIFTIKSKPIISVTVKIIASILLLLQITSVCMSQIYWGRLSVYYFLGEEIKAQTIKYNYYLSYYHPNKKLDDFKREYYADSIPVFLHEVDKYAMHGYLPIHGINWEPNTDMIAAVDRYFVITAFEDMAIANFQQYDSTFEFHRISGDIDFVNIIEADRIK